MLTVERAVFFLLVMCCLHFRFLVDEREWVGLCNVFISGTRALSWLVLFSLICTDLEAYWNSLWLVLQVGMSVDSFCCNSCKCDRLFERSGVTEFLFAYITDLVNDFSYAEVGWKMKVYDHKTTNPPFLFYFAVNIHVTAHFNINLAINLLILCVFLLTVTHLMLAVETCF